MQFENPPPGTYEIWVKTLPKGIGKTGQLKNGCCEKVWHFDADNESGFKLEFLVKCTNFRNKGQVYSRLEIPFECIPINTCLSDWFHFKSLIPNGKDFRANIQIQRDDDRRAAFSAPPAQFVPPTPPQIQVVYSQVPVYNPSAPPQSIPGMYQGPPGAYPNPGELSMSVPPGEYPPQYGQPPQYAQYPQYSVNYPPTASQQFPPESQQFTQQTQQFPPESQQFTQQSQQFTQQTQQSQQMPPSYPQMPRPDAPLVYPQEYAQPSMDASQQPPSSIPNGIPAQDGCVKYSDLA